MCCGWSGSGCWGSLELGQGDRFLLEVDAEAGLDGLLDAVAERSDIDLGGVAAIDECKGVARGDACFA